MITVESWLRSFGFVKDPFETTEAGSEVHYATDFLHETFVKPQGFDEILGHPSHPKSSLVFAARGKGKTSARLMTAHFCREGIFPKEMNIKEGAIARVLPVHHTHFESLIGASSPTALVDAHVIEILYRAVQATVNMTIQYSDIAERINHLDALRRLELQYFLNVYKKYVSPQEHKIASDLFGREIIDLLEEAHAPIGFPLPLSNQRGIGLSAQETQAHLAAYSQMQPIDLVGRFTALMIDSGLSAVYVLVDGVDEIPETANDFVAAANLLFPLLANLNLMTNTPYLAFKVFVPTEMKLLLLEGPNQIRRDRLAVRDIGLETGDLVEILRRRLAYCSDGVVASMDALCSVELRGKIEMEMASRAEENPRRMVLIGRYMLEHRCEVMDSDDRQESFLLDKDDLDWAIRAIGGEPAQAKIADSSKSHAVVVQSSTPPQSTAPTTSSEWFRHEFPAPIALAYLVYERESIAHIRLWKMYELVEASLAFLSQVLLAVLYQEMDNNTPAQLKKNGLRLELASMGVWRTALEKLPGMLAGLGIHNAFARTCQRVLSKNGDFIHVVNDERNRSAHGGPQPEKECEALIEQYAQPLQQYLTSLSFLRENHLVKVVHVHKHDNKYLHRCVSYSGDAIVFPTIDIEVGTTLESECLWLLGRDGPVNLHPLMLVTAGEKLGEVIWLYQGIDKDAVSYKSYGMGQTSSFSDLRNEVIGLLGTP